MVMSEPLSFKIFKSVEFVRTLGMLVTTRTDTFLEGKSPSSLRISLPCLGQTRPYILFFNMALSFSCTACPTHRHVCGRVDVDVFPS